MFKRDEKLLLNLFFDFNDGAYANAPTPTIAAPAHSSPLYLSLQEGWHLRPSIS